MIWPRRPNPAPAIAFPARNESLLTLKFLGEFVSLGYQWIRDAILASVLTIQFVTAINVLSNGLDLLRGRDDSVFLKRGG